MSYDSFIGNKKTVRNAEALAYNFLNKWDQNNNSSTQELLWLIKNYKNFNSILILQVVDEELIKRKIDNMYIGLYELIITMLVDQFIIEWIDCYNCNIYAENRYTEIREDFDFSGVPFVIGYLESSLHRDDEDLPEQPNGFYVVKKYFSEMLVKKLEENSIIQENRIMRETVERCEHAEDGILFTMARDIAIMDYMHNNGFPCITNDNLIRIPYDPNMIVHNYFILSWFYKMFAHAQLELSHPVKNVSKLPSEIIDYMIKKYFKYSYFCLKLQ